MAYHIILEYITAGFRQLGTAFTTDIGIWWLLTPIFLLWIVMEIYAGEYKQERFGFSSALANGFSLFWISLTSFRVFLFIDKTYLNKEAYSDPRLYILALFVLYALFIMYAAFTHTMRTSLTKIIAGPALIYSFSVLSVLWGQRLLVVNTSILSALVISFIIIVFIFFIIRRQLGVRGDVEHILELGKDDHAQE
ncbi:MAG: hypothetical protein COU90_00020 [Candidatus Ryanbacteria bacterium CG10_big_fil_rev_8_21_14_0_10_43_42]|uniref:Uncharacterized protein n=1 Tax=Candidatus Ryanbacteria bacterium CG10_big_fil_rev_8_21_14_0_10_43_42 TaxID=1974864 RepID=A0A2M8KYD2_9BACT|nr:MAG: hypothetical protein COU90_00020 [Candidatus Ryanbacteria bacterium CG10_big_fil_rev_8_21_14_0_10_43_42]